MSNDEIRNVCNLQKQIQKAAVCCVEEKELAKRERFYKETKMSRWNICVVLMALLGTLLAEEQVQHNDAPPQRTARFGISILDRLRQSFCNSFCMSADTSSYFTNIMCAAKCPELYLPHGTTTPGSASPTASPSTTTASTTTTTTSMTTTSITTPTTSSTTPSTTTAMTPSTTPTTTTTTMMSPSPAMGG